MTESVINRVAAGGPVAEGTIRFVRLGRSESLSLAELARRAEVLAARLAELGVGRGDRVGG
ncbi:hypothetical protein GCM10020295_16250 [Streptomyces cinereospinus]